MKIDIYHIEKLPLTTRSDFELPAWPYRTDNPKCRQVFDKYMKDLTVFYYKDSEVMYGRQNIDHPLYIGEDTFDYPFEAHYSSVFVDNSQFKVIDWPQNERTPLLKAIKSCPIRGDMKAWDNFNIPVEVFGFPFGFIQREFIREEEISDLKVEGDSYGGGNSGGQSPNFRRTR